MCVCVCMWQAVGGSLTPSMALSATAQVFRITYLLGKRGKMFFSLKKKSCKNFVSDRIHHDLED